MFMKYKVCSLKQMEENSRYLLLVSYLFTDWTFFVSFLPPPHGQACLQHAFI